MRVGKCLFCVDGQYAGPGYAGSVFEASSERRVPSGISGSHLREMCFCCWRKALCLCPSCQKGLEKSSWEGEGINSLCQLIGQWVTDSLNRSIDSRKEIDLWLLQCQEGISLVDASLDFHLCWVLHSCCKL